MSNNVTRWLEQLDLGEYAAVFAENDIDWELLPELDQEILKEIGITSTGHRLRILKSVRTLKSESSDADPIAEKEPATSTYNAPHAEAERRQLTVMFCDLVGSTGLSEGLDLETYRELLIAYQDTAREAIMRYDGYIARYMGDGLLVYFGYPTAHEEDAERAVRAGLDVVEMVSKLSTPGEVSLCVRVGIATGLVVAGDLIGEGASEELAVLGETPNLAARLQGIATPNSVVVAETTQRLVEGRFEFEVLRPQSVKGFSKPVRAFKAIEIKATSRFDAATTRGVSAIVGRRSELQLLIERWTQAKEGEGQVVLLSGEAGIGKSRMLLEFQNYMSEMPHTSLRYQCSPYGSKIAFSPIIEQLQQSAGFTHQDSVSQKLDKLERLLSQAADDVSVASPLLAALLALPGERYSSLTMTPQRQKLDTIKVLVAQIEGLARQQPVLMQVEDLHWIDPSTLETFDAVVEHIQMLPVLVVITHRPEFESNWGRFGHVTHHSLNRLSRADGIALSGRVTGGKALPNEVMEHILEHTDGVPLFIEELTKMVLETGLLSESSEGYILNNSLPNLAIPETLQDSLMARLDRLSAAKEVAQAAACIGREFSAKLLSKVLKRRSLEGDLKQLMDAELIFHRGVGENAVYVFKHALVQDVAYESLLESNRRQLHTRIAQEFEASPGAEPGVLARQFSAAGLAEKAADYFLDSGRRSLSVSALPEAGSELEMGLREIDALASSPVRDQLELDLRTTLGSVKVATLGWAHSSVSAVYVPAFVLAEAFDDRQAMGLILWGLCVHYWTRAEFPKTLHWLAKLEGAVEQSGDSELTLVRDMSAGCQYFWQAEYDRAYRYTANILATYDERRHASIAANTNHDPLCFSLHWAGSLLQWITGYPDRGLELVDEAHALAHRINHPFNSAFALTAGSECLLMRGETGRVLRHCDEVQIIVDEEGLGDFAQHVLISNWRGRALTREGDFEAGYPLINLATTFWRQSEGRVCSALFWGGEAIALGGLGRTREALELINAAIDYCRDTGDRYMEPEVLRVKAELLLAAGDSDSDTVEAILIESIKIANDHKAKSWELRTATSLAKLMNAQGRQSRARDLLAPIYNWFSEGFDTSDLRDAKALLNELS